MAVDSSQTHVPIPQIEDLFYVILQALGQFPEPVPYREVDDAAIHLMGFEGDSYGEARLRERLGFARSALKRIGAADNEQRGFWAITDAGKTYLEQEPASGQKALSTDINASYADRTVDRGFLEEARQRAALGQPMRLTVRELIEQWKVSRRGAVVNQQIRQDLDTIGLRTEPDFTTTWIDGEVALVGDASPPVDASKRSNDAGPNDDITLTVGSIEAASRGVKSVPLDDTLVHAQSVMMRYDYSQLAVLSGPRNVRGAVSWESIAQERLRNPHAEHVRDCLIAAKLVRPGDHLLDVVPDVVDQGFVFVQAADSRLLGIVTMADLSVQFASLANPFVLIGEIERWMRRALDGSFAPAELVGAVDANDPDRDIESAANLTLGEMIRVLQFPQNWERLGWAAVDRNVFLEALDDVRRIRNETMHFSPDPLSDEDLEALSKLLRWIRHLMDAK